MEIIENRPEKLVIRMKANLPLANSIRRSISEIPILAVDEVEIYKNDSASYDEVLAHRIGLIPLKMDKKMSEKTKIEFKLSKKGPCIVYSGDLKGSVDVVHEKIPITILGDEHKLELVATATLGKGFSHAKYLPGICYYRHLLEVKSSPTVDKIIQGSRGAIKPEKKGSKWLCDLNDGEIKEIEDKEKDAISDSEEIIFVIESYGNVPAKEILIGAAEAIEENLHEFEKSIK